MQHLDEGTIHAWLDGALSADEAARAEAHVKDCAQCQAAVAEARGFIAASSRILTALDNAPRGVIPATAPAKRMQPWVWRVAATVLVVATGTVLLVRERTTERYSSLEARVPAPHTQAGQLDKIAATDSTSTAATSQITAKPGVVGGTAAVSLPRALPTAPKNAPLRAYGRDLGSQGAQNGGRLDERSETGAAAPRQMSSPSISPAQTMQPRVFGALSGVVAETPRQVATRHTTGKTETLYEIAPGDTVVLEEETSAQLQNIAATGAASTSARAQPMLRSSKTAAVAESQQKAESATPATAAPAAPPPAAALQDAQVSGIHRISWLDPPNGRVVILSGRHSQDELQEIRKKIQQLRDAASRPKELPD